MTLRHRLFLVYLIVVLLSVATVGVAIYELKRTQNVYGPLLPQIWTDVARDAARLETAFVAMAGPNDKQSEFEALLAGEQLKVALAADFLDVDYIREHYLFRLHRAYQRWKEAAPGSEQEQAEQVLEAVRAFGEAVDDAGARLSRDLEQQRARTWVLLGVALGLAVLHVVFIGWLLRRWLLWPMERLNRQVEALAKDQPPAEPLLTAPLEMARLAAALDRARQSLQVYRQQLLDNERLTTIGQFAAQLAHNLRNPLASIRAASQVTARHERGNAYVHERMDEVVACVDRLNRWIAGLMEVARRDPTPTRSADVVPLLDRVREAVGPDLAVKELTLSVDAPAGGMACTHDSATLEQALIAMMVNAIEASPLGGAIVLRAERLAGADPICRISVNDEGPGLPVDDPERIFEFAYSTKQAGMGLGLALARLALDRQGGEAHACNRAEGGARVYVDLPIREGEK